MTRRTQRTLARIALALIVALLAMPLLALADPLPNSPPQGDGVKGVPREAARYQRELTRHARSVWGLDAPVAVLAAQIHQESRWREDAQSPVGAQGIAQFMPETATWISGAYRLGAAQPNNPSWAMRALATYDRHLWDRVEAVDPCERMAMTLSAYNGGLRWVYSDQALAAKRAADRRRWFDNVEKFNAGRSAESFAENRGYPRAILLKWQATYAPWGGAVKCERER